MSDYSLLLRKELKEMFSFRRKEKKKIDIAGLLITLFLTVSIIVPSFTISTAKFIWTWANVSW